MKSTLALLLCLPIVCGCSGSSSRGAIEGEVTFTGGRPLPSGKIRFLPLEQTAGAPVFTEIKDGKYQIDAARGPAVGKHRVEITAFRKSAEKIPVQDGPPGQFQEVDEQYLPGQYNINSQIVVEIAPGPNKKDIVLQGIK